MSTLFDRQRSERLARAIREKKIREARALQSNPKGGLYEFVKYFWHILEPVDQYVDGWPVEALCAHLEGISAGETIVIGDNVKKFNRLLANVPPGFMKALDCETPVLTLAGWKRHGDLRKGDFVFGPDGELKRVLGCTEPGDELSYEVEFDDGSVIVAGEGHLWQVERDHPYGAPGGRRCRKVEVVTTPNLIASVKGRALQRPDRIPVAAPLAFPAKRLLIEPYVLGAWLGDGATKAGVLYAAHQDIEHFKALGQIAHIYPAEGTRKQDFYRINIEDLQVRLRILGILDNKHIPDDYLEASIEQRWELLRGLMDTDGCAAIEGHCSYTTKLEHLAQQVLQLASSLGLKACLKSRMSKLNGVLYGPHYFVTFTAPEGVKVFALERKQARLRGNMNARSRGRYVQAVRPVGLRRVNCIQVEGQLYLAGKTFVTTHNSLLTNVFWPAWEWGPQERPHLRYLSFSYTPELTQRDNGKLRDLITSHEYRALWGHVFSIVGDGKIRVTNDKTGFKFATSIGGVGTGERGHRVILDDPNKLKVTEESDEARDAISNWVLEGMQNRLNDLERDAIVVIMQRVHEADSSGAILKKLARDYCHLVIPMEYESGRHFSHYRGWNNGLDPRDTDGELAWAERYPRRVLASFKANAYLWSGQYQQTPTPRGGGLFKEHWWQVQEVRRPPGGGALVFVPELKPIFVVASLDTAFSEKEENDLSALSIYAVADDPITKHRKIVLVEAWQKRLPELSGERVDRRPDESEAAWRRRAQPKWGLVEWVAYSCQRRRANVLIVENKNRAPDVIRTMRRHFQDRDFGIQAIDIRGDKWGRANAVVDLFTDGMIYAPAEVVDGEVRWLDWADEAIRDVCVFPRGAHDDMVDSMTMALKYLRDRGLAIRRDEAASALRDALTHRGNGARPSIYDV